MTKPEFDVRSAAPVLSYVAGEVAGVPAADLSANTLARIAWLRGGSKLPRTDPQEAIARLRDELIATGKYTSVTEDKKP